MRCQWEPDSVQLSWTNQHEIRSKKRAHLISWIQPVMVQSIFDHRKHVWPYFPHVHWFGHSRCMNRTIMHSKISLYFNSATLSMENSTPQKPSGYLVRRENSTLISYLRYLLWEIKIKIGSMRRSRHNSEWTNSQSWQRCRKAFTPQFSSRQ